MHRLILANERTIIALVAAKLDPTSAAASCPGANAMNVAGEAVWAVLAATWIVGLVNQFESWPMTAFYLAMSLAMIAVMFGHRGVLNFAKRPPADKARKL
jgi:hypothetical protein